MNTDESLRKLVEDNERLKIEHKLSFDEANRLWIEHTQALYVISKLESKLNQSKHERTSALNECSNLKTDLSESKIELNKALDDASRLRSKLSRCETDKEQAFTELSRLKRLLEKKTFRHVFNCDLIFF